MNESIKNNTLGFRIYNITTRYFPRGLDGLFKNLKVIEISNGQLKEIHQTDLKPFINLEVLYFQSNDIEILENGLFDYNKNLTYILFNKNKLVHIDGSVFEKLHHLTDLYLYGNECINDFTVNNSTVLQKITKTIKSQCQNEDFINLNKNLSVLESTNENLKVEDFPEFYANITDLEDSRFSQYSTIKKRIKALKDRNISSLWNKIINLSDLIGNQNMTIMKRLMELEDIQKIYNHINADITNQTVKNNSEGLNVEQMKILDELRLNFTKISAVQGRQASKVTESTFTWEPFWIGVCSVLVLILMILLIKNYVVEDRIISYSISDYKRYNHEGNRVSVL